MATRMEAAGLLRRHLDRALAKMVRNLQQVPPSQTEEAGIA